MRLIVTENLHDLETDKNISVITTSSTVVIECLKRNIEVCQADRLVENSDAETILLLEDVNQCMLEGWGHCERLEMLWKCVYSSGEPRSRTIEEMLQMIKNCMPILEKNIDAIDFYYSKSNVRVYNIVKAIARVNDIPIKIVFSSWKERICWYANHVNILKYFILNGKSLFHIVPAFKWVIIIKDNKKRNYTYGDAQYSNATRQYEWLMQKIDEIKKFDSYKILCVGCKAMYQRLKKSGIETDLMDEWLTFHSAVKNIIEYLKLRKSARYNILKTLKFVYKNIDFSNALSEELLQYIYSDMALRYRWNMICESYFKCNSFSLIEPFCVASYPQTRVFYINTKNVKYCRTNSVVLFGSRDGGGIWNNIFDIIFFPSIGLDYKKEYDQCGWGRERYYIDIKSIAMYQRWHQNKSSNFDDGRFGDFMMLYAPTGGDTAFVKSNERYARSLGLLDLIKGCDVKFVYKFHPGERNLPWARELIKEYSQYNNITFAGDQESIWTYLEKAALVITDASTVILDGIVKRVPVMCLMNAREHKTMNYLEDNVLIYEDVETLFQAIMEFWNNEQGYRNWRKERIRCQDKMFEVETEGINPWEKLREIAAID